MTLKFRFAAGISLLVAALLAAACGGQVSLSPTSPSGIGVNTAGSTGAVVSGIVNGMAPARAARFDTASTETLVVTVIGTNLSTAVDGSGRFSLSGVPGGTIRLQFKGRGVDGTITIASVTAGDRIEITVTVNGGTIRLDGERREGHNGNRTEVEGPITAIDAAARTIRVRDRLIEVPATAVIRRGGTRLTFADLRAGDRVEVKASVDGSRIIAGEVHVHRDDDDEDDDDDDEDDDDDRDRAEVRGVVSGLQGTCPAITFTLQSVIVTTTSRTRFEDGSCAAVRNNIEVKAKGQRQANGSLVAAEVELED